MKKNPVHASVSDPQYLRLKVIYIELIYDDMLLGAKRSILGNVGHVSFKIQNTNMYNHKHTL